MTVLSKIVDFKTNKLVPFLQTLHYSLGFVVICIGGCYYLGTHRWPQHIVLTVATKSCTFETAGKNTVILAPPQALGTISVNRFQSVTFPSGQMWRSAEPDSIEFTKAGNVIPESAWRNATPGSGVVTFAAGSLLGSQMRLESTDDRSRPFTLEPVEVSGHKSIKLSVNVGKTTAELSTVIVREQPGNGNRPVESDGIDGCRVTYDGPFQLLPTGCRISGISLKPGHATPYIYRVNQRSEQNPQTSIHVAGSDGGLGINVSVAKEDFPKLFPPTPCYIQSIDFTDLDGRSGTRNLVSQISSINGSYDDAPKPWSFPGSNDMTITGLTDFRISNIALDEQGLKMTMDGTVTSLKVGPDDRELIPNELLWLAQGPYGNFIQAMVAVVTILLTIVEHHRNKNEPKQI